MRTAALAIPLAVALVSSAAEPLTPALLEWKRDIEAAGTPLYIARVDYDAASNAYSIPPDTEGGSLFEHRLGQDEILVQFHQMYASMIYHRSAGGNAFLVLLNGARKSEWEEHEEALLAHEFGHAWIKSKGYPSPLFQPGLAGCLTVHAGDVIQHILLREEMRKRKIDFVPFWLQTLDAAVAVSASQGESAAKPDGCTMVKQAAEWVDVRLGLQDVEWPGRERYEAAVRKNFPSVESAVNELVAYLKKRDVSKREVYSESMHHVFARLRKLAHSRDRQVD
jgi:hypothetical protein